MSPAEKPPFWERLVAIRGEFLHILGPAGWLVGGAVFMLIVLAAMRAAGGADHPEL